jgi:hypothetical protein
MPDVQERLDGGGAEPDLNDFSTEMFVQEIADR